MMISKLLKISALVAAAALSGCTTGDDDDGSTSSSGGNNNAASCGTRPGNNAADNSSTSTKATIDAVIGTNTLTSGTAFANANYCGNADGNAYWWKLSGAHASGATFRLQIAFANGTTANDVDFDVVYFDADGMGYTNVASCSAASGTNEDCMGSITQAITDIYVKTDTTTVTTQEKFTITLTKT
jgi:hypothetical protein